MIRKFDRYLRSLSLHVVSGEQESSRKTVPEEHLDQSVSSCSSQTRNLVCYENS